jgi:phospholipid/cholesterol/gamma-HCH transport system permease protein
MPPDKHSLELPRRLSIENVSTLFKEIKKLETGGELEIDFQQVESFDSSAIALVNYLKQRPGTVSLKNLTPEFQRRFEMFSRGAGAASIPTPTAPRGLRKQMEALGAKFVSFKQHLRQFLVLLTDETFYTIQYLFNRKGVYPGDIINQLFFMGYKSYPIVSIISFLVGVTISITSAEQLRNFGADIYLADLVGFGMIRELVPLMTGIILAGKIGAAITAEIASMKVMEETDALTTMGIVPEKFLMVPRLLAMTMAIPLLVAIADFVGIFAGVLVARVVSDIPPTMFFNEMFTVVGISDFFIGLAKTLVFGWVVVISSGYKGFSVERGATGVGIATTESVVLSISLIIIFDCIFALVLY